MLRLEQIRGLFLMLLPWPAARLACARRLAAHGAHRAARPLLIRAARAGLPAACDELGRAYLYGHGVPPSLTEALSWLNRAAEADEPAAQSLLANLALQGITSAAPDGLFASASAATAPPDYARALHWAERAARNGFAEALALLGFIRTSGPDAMRSRADGERFYQAAAEAGTAQGKLGWAMALLRRNTPEAAMQACTLLHSAAAAGLPAAHYLLGAITESGVAGEQDFATATEHYRDAAEHGHAAAQFRYGMALLAGRGIEPDAFEAESWLRRAALAGESAAAAVVGDLYAAQGALPPNYVEAAAWFRRAAEAGHAGAARALARLILRGAGVPADPQEAIHWLRTAIAGGDAGARADLAALALARLAPEADRQATCAWFRERAAAGDAGAACNLGTASPRASARRATMPRRWRCSAARPRPCRPRSIGAAACSRRAGGPAPTRRRPAPATSAPPPGGIPMPRWPPARCSSTAAAARPIPCRPWRCSAAPPPPGIPARCMR